MKREKKVKLLVLFREVNQVLQDQKEFKDPKAKEEIRESICLVTKEAQETQVRKYLYWEMFVLHGQ